MEKQQAGQEETLMEIKMETDSLDIVRQPRGSSAERSGCFKFVVIIIIMVGLVTVAVVPYFIFNALMFTPSCNQDVGPPSDTEKIKITSTLKESDEKGWYDIFTTKKDATYLIYGWVKTSDMATEEVILMCTWRSHTRTLQKKTKSDTETVFFFSTEVNLINNSKISIYLKSNCTDSVFHVYEL